MLKRILCPAHKEETPSCVVYEDGHAFCYGCHTRFEKEALTGVSYEGEIKPRFKENVGETLEYIRCLKKETIRGLELPADDECFYIVWPYGNYYKKRFKHTESNSDKYRCPVGVSKPLFILHAALPSRAALVIEGEINSLSVWEATKEYDIYCPGGAGDFYSNSIKEVAPQFSEYQKLVVFCDRDPAGAIAAIKFKAMMTQFITHIDVNLLETDFNETLQKEGKEALNTKVRSYVGL